jgi:hypothetical protein
MGAFLDAPIASEEASRQEQKRETTETARNGEGEEEDIFLRGDSLNADSWEMSGSNSTDFGLDVDLDDKNRLVAEKAGQILFGAPNGVGVNFKPSGDFALEVLGAIFSTEPSQLGVSDRRVKEGFRSVDVLACLGTGRALELKDFRFKGAYRHAPRTGRREDGRHRGFIAQQVAETLPAAVVTTRRTEALKDGTVVDNVRAVNMGPIVMEALGAIQALSQQADILEAEIAALELQLQLRQ